MILKILKFPFRNIACIRQRLNIDRIPPPRFIPDAVPTVTAVRLASYFEQRTEFVPVFELLDQGA